MRTTFTVHHNKHVSSRPFEAGRRFLQAYRLTQPVVQTMLPLSGLSQWMPLFWLKPASRRQLSATDDCLPHKTRLPA